MSSMYHDAHRPALRAASREDFVELESLAGRGLPRISGDGASALPRKQAAPLEEARNVIDFWRAAGPSLWFAKNPDFDSAFRERFLALHETAAHCELTPWRNEPEGALALLLLLDQFPRNAFRGTPRMYATDAAAREIAAAAVDVDYDQRFPSDLRLFFYLPFGHSEIIADQERSVALNISLGEPNLSHARRHHGIVLRFGRFPHRNPILGRQMRPEEQRFLDEGGYAG
jgi:uncharacterized protein (DUF924 family)